MHLWLRSYTNRHVIPLLVQKPGYMIKGPSIFGYIVQYLETTDILSTGLQYTELILIFNNM